MTWDTTIRAYAPGRVNLIGEHTDYNLGYALPIALEVGTVAEFTPAAGDLIADSAQEPDRAVISLDTAPGEVSGWGGYVAGCVWALRQAGHGAQGGRLSLTSTVPVGAGLSSSAALECAVLLALTAGHDLDRHEVARLAQHAENDYVGAPTGLLDQLASLYGRRDTALLVDFRSLEVTPVRVDLGEDTRLLIIDSHAPHEHAGGEYRARRASCEEAAAELGAASLRDCDAEDWRALTGVTARRARHILTENQRVLDSAAALGRGDFGALGVLMDASHASMHDDFEITTVGIDAIAAAARDLGAYGARMTGGGFGGSVIAFAPAAAAAAIARSLPDSMESAGYPRPTVTSVRPGRGAHLL